MKLFHQLSQEDQQMCVHECIHRIIDSMVEDGSPIIDPETDEQKKLDIEVKAAIETLRQMNNGEEQVDYVMNNEAIKDMVLSLSVKLAESSYIAETTDSVIFLEEEGAHDHSGDDDDEDDDVITNHNSKKELN